MGEYYGLAVVACLVLLLPIGHCDVRCGGIDGQPGHAGTPGRDGWPGVKGDKGEPAVVDNEPLDVATMLRLKGEMGSRGLQGPMGPKGYSGDLGPMGLPGNPGQPGRGGEAISHNADSSQQTHSAFSVIRNTNIYPPYNQVVTYQKTVVNTLGDFNAVTGYFTCRVPGVYYFVFHSGAKVSMCLRLASDVLGENKLGFCNRSYNTNLNQVLSGGAVLQLASRQKVWLESFRDVQTSSDQQDLREKEIIFNGFLLFSNAE
ncbi:hypothetical protein PAMP_016921 [Pampus punctatissimus]